jgi:hypothetical protein
MITQQSDQQAIQPDPAAVFGCALSLWRQCNKRAESDPNLNLSDSYHGIDELMRQVMRIANQFEQWACLHILFDELNDVWPYMLEDKFGAACLDILNPDGLTQFDETDCLRVALHMNLPVMLDEKLPIPIDVRASNPISDSIFREFRIQTVRTCGEDNAIAPFTVCDEPFDEEFGPPYFAIYGIEADGSLEHVADRSRYSDALDLLQKLAPGIQFPTSPTAKYPMR